MGFSIRKLQAVMLAGAALLVLVTAAYLGYSHSLARGFRLKLPGKLGIDIQQQADSFTYSQSVQGKTVYTIHAAKAIQHNDGKWTLHDVGIALYGEKQDRNDRISGSQFEYDERAGRISAAGEVQIDLSAAPTATKLNAGQQDDHVIHVKTSGLSFDSKSHRAVTTQRIDFKTTGYVGHAIGADYNSDSGLIVLGSEVFVTGAMDDSPSVLNAAHAELNQKTNIVDLTAPHYVSGTEAEGQETAIARHAVIHTAKDNNPDRVRAEGAVTLSEPGMGTLVADQADALLLHGRSQSAHLFGNLRYTDDEPARHATGRAEDARIAFDSLGRPAQAVVSGNVFAREQRPATVREVHAPTVELSFAAQSRQHSILRDAKAFTGARLHLVDTVAQKSAKAPVSTISDLSGDVLTAHFDSDGRIARLATVNGAGNTALHRVDEQGADAVSTGRQLDATFRPQTAKPGASKPPDPTAVELERAIQTGAVQLQRTTVATPGTPSVTQHGSAQEAIYEAASDSATLNGAAYLGDPTGAVWAQRIVLLRGSGDATAEGAVRATYLQPSQPSQTAPTDPVHVLSDRAVFHHDDSVAMFFGKPARMWQTGTQIEAPILELDRNRHTLYAHSPMASDDAAVHAVLVSRPPQTSSAKPAPGKAEPRPPSPIRIASRELTYNDTTRQIDLRGSVVAQDSDATLQARQAIVFLLPVGKPGTAPLKSTPAVAIPGGQFDRIVATGDIELRQPGRLATGDRLVYTASDGVSVLTGTPSAPPTAIDDAQGTVTGDSLRFASGDNGIVATGAGGTRRVHTASQRR